MTVQLAKSAVDIGIVVSDSSTALAFYRDLLGMEHVSDIIMPIGDGGTMHRLMCGDSLIKLVKLDNVPPRHDGGGIEAGQGFRYLTLVVENLDEIMADCRRDGVEVKVPVTEVRPGVTIGIVADPDGNWVEFVQNG